jgi:cell division septum initiation protein DivIVA
MAAPGNQQEIDLEEVRKLLDVLERDLEHVTDDTTAVQRLKDEVQTLRNVLDSPVQRHHWVRDSLHGIREAFDAAVGTKASRYIAEIGRILGLP